MKKLYDSEEEFVLLLKQRDMVAYTKLYDNYAPGLLGVIMQVLRNQDVSEEVLQNVFVKIWKNIESYDASRGRLYTWMINIAINSAIDYSKSKRAKQEKITQSMDVSIDAVNHQTSNSLNTDVIGLKEQVVSLKEEYRVLIELVYYKGLTQEETAKELNIPLGTVKTRIRAAVSELRQKFK